MNLGWQGIARVIAVTVAVTSAFWVLLGGYLFHRHLNDDLARGLNKTPALAFAQVRQSVSRNEDLVQPMVVPVDAPPQAQPLAIPVAGVQPRDLVDTFMQARAGGQRRHDAIDIMAPPGTPVIAAAPGRIEKLFVSKDGGNTVYQRSDDGRVLYYYAHIDRYAPDLREGRLLSRGAPIGFVGTTGNANPDAPHLHFAVMLTSPDRKWYQEATAVDPYPLLGGLAAPRAAAGR